MNSIATKDVELHGQADVWSLAFSPDGKQIATSSPSTEAVSVWLWQGNPSVAQTLQHPKGGSPNGLRYSADGTLLAVAHGPDEANQLVRIWNTTTATVVGDISDRFGQGSGSLKYAALAFSPDGQFLMRSQGGGSHMEGSTEVFVDSFVVHETKAWGVAWGLKTEPFHPDALGVSSDGRWAAIAGWERVMRGGIVLRVQTKIMLIDLTAREARFSGEILSDSCTVEFVVWSPDGQRIAVGGNPMDTTGPRPPALELLDAKSGKSLGSFPARSNMVALDFSPDGRYLLVGWGSKGVEIWDGAHGKLLQSISGNPTAAKFSHDGRHLAIASGSEITIWDMK
jgi:WD40 repeat protein